MPSKSSTHWTSKPLRDCEETPSFVQDGDNDNPKANTVRIVIVACQGIAESGLRALFAGTNEFLVVGSAASGRDALVLAKKVRPAIVIIDGMLPDLTAVDVIGRLRGECPETKVVALSSDMFWRSVVGVFRAGAWGFVTKERSFDDLTAALRSVSRGHRFVDGRTGGLLAFAWSEVHGTTAEISLASLSRRESEVFRLLVDGKNAAEIAKSLFISRKTAETHRRAVLKKLKVRDMAELMKLAARNRLLNP